MKQTCAELIAELFDDPIKFYEAGRSYLLLQEFFFGESVETLRPLLASKTIFVQRAAIFIASELGKQACPVMDDVIPLLRSDERYIQYYAMDVIAVCAVGERAQEFALVVEMLESPDEVLRRRSMELMSRVELAQIAAARHLLAARGSCSEVHDRGLRVLGDGQHVDPITIEKMIEDVNALVRRYGGIAARRLAYVFPALMKLMETSNDADLRGFSEAPR